MVYRWMDVMGAFAVLPDKAKLMAEGTVRRNRKMRSVVMAAGKGLIFGERQKAARGVKLFLIIWCVFFFLLSRAAASGLEGEAKGKIGPFLKTEVTQMQSEALRDDVVDDQSARERKQIVEVFRQ